MMSYCTPIKDRRNQRGTDWPQNSKLSWSQFNVLTSSTSTPPLPPNPKKRQDTSLPVHWLLKPTAQPTIPQSNSVHRSRCEAHVYLPTTSKASLCFFDPFIFNTILTDVGVTGPGGIGVGFSVTAPLNICSTSATASLKPFLFSGLPYFSLFST